MEYLGIVARGKVEYTNEFEGWWHSLSEAEQAEIDAKVELLQEQGPMLPRPTPM